MKKSELVESVFALKGVPFSFKNREMMRDLFDMDYPATVLMMGRQVGKSTTLAYDILSDCLIKPWFNTLYIAPRQDQVSVFSGEKLAPAIRYSPVFNQLMVEPSRAQNVFDKDFANNSKIYLRAAFLTADSIRGITADKTVIDEAQDIIYNNVGIIEKCLDGSDYQYKLYSGTPKTCNNTLALLYNKSTRNEFIVKCPSCNKWNIISLENIGPDFLQCKSCKKKLGPPFAGEWVALNPKSKVVGFRLPQVLSPTVIWDNIIAAKEDYPLFQFMNEVLALPFDSGHSPITETDLMSACDPEAKNKLLPTGHRESGVLVLGVDWGHGDLSLASKRRNAPTGYTVATLGLLKSDGRFVIKWMKKFKGTESDPMFQIKEIAYLAKMQKVAIVGADHGDGFFHNIELRQRMNNVNLLEFSASGNVKAKIKWDPEVDSNRITFHRTRCMSEVFHAIKKKRITFFNWDDMFEFSSDFLTIFIDKSSSTTRQSMFYNHITPDDAFHSMMIAYNAAIFYKKHLR